MSAKMNIKKHNGTGLWPAPLLRFTGILLAALIVISLLPFWPALSILSENERLFLPLKNGQEFSIKYNHSVNRSPVIDTIERTGDTLTIRRSLYQTYGAGIPVLSDMVGDTYTETDEGFLLSGIDSEHESINLITGTYADHHLIYKDAEYQLKKTFGEKTLITFSAQKVSTLQLLIYRP